MLRSVKVGITPAYQPTQPMLNWLTRYASVIAELDFDRDGQLGESVLDVGCGPHGLACAAPAARFVGTDVLFAGQVASGMTAFRTDPGPLPFADASFDTVVCLDTLEHIPSADRGGFVKELARVAARRVIVACPSEGSAQLQDILRLEYSVRGLPLPGWLNEHDEHGLPSAAQIRDVCSSVEGFSATEMQMANGLLAMLTVMADMLPEFAERAAAEFRENGGRWLELFTAARFGDSNRRGYVVERDMRKRPRIGHMDLEQSVWEALRCSTCGATGLLARADGAQCPNCARTYRRDATRAFDWTKRAGEGAQTLTPVRQGKATRLLLRPQWDRLETWLPVLAVFVGEADPDGDYALCIDAVDVGLGIETIQQLTAFVCETISGGRRFPEVVLLDTPYVSEGLAAVRDAAELRGLLGLAVPPRASDREAVARHARSAKLLCDSARAIIERRRYAVAEDPWTSREPLVSVRIPSWNGHRTLVERTIPSVLSSGYPNFELIVCSDGPDDAARRAVQGFIDPRVRYLELPERPAYPEQPWSLWQSGGSHAANAAVEQARGTFIAPLDHDDTFTVDHIDVLLSAAAERGADLVYGQAMAEDRDGGWRTLGAEPLGPDNVTHGAALYSARLAHVGLDPDCWLLDEKGDWNMYRRMAETGAGVAFDSKVVLVHFREQTSITDELGVTAIDGLHVRQPEQIYGDLMRTGIDWLLDIPLSRAGG
jgi:SAM-dependent methyltransferase